MTQPPEPGTPDPNAAGQPQQPGPYPSQPGQYPQQPGPYPSQPGPYGPPPGPYPQQPGPYGPPLGQYPQQPGPYGQPPKKSRKALFIVIGLVVAALIAGLIAIGVIAARIEVGGLDVGDCLYFESVSTTAADTQHDKRDCSDADATYEVAQKLDGNAECSGDYFSYSLIKGDDDVQETLCLIPNMVEGSCYLLEDGGRILGSECSSTDSVEVVKRADGEEDEALCEEFANAIAFAFPEPKRTYCIDVNIE